MGNVLWLAAGLTAYDAASGEHLLHTQRLPAEVLKLVTPLVLRWTAELSCFKTSMLWSLQNLGLTVSSV